jgi:hypothetical protein
MEAKLESRQALVGMRGERKSTQCNQKALRSYGVG